MSEPTAAELEAFQEAADAARAFAACADEFGPRYCGERLEGLQNALDRLECVMQTVVPQTGDDANAPVLPPYKS